MLAGIISELLPWIAGAVALIAAILGYGARQRAKGRTDAATRAMRDAITRQEEGRNAVQDLRGAGRDDLLEQLRRNEGRW